MAVSIAEAIRIAMEHHHAGRLPDAERIYRLILAQTPDQPDANHLLGVIYIQHDRNLEALPYLKRAVQLVPTFPDFQNNLGIAYRNLGRMDDAVECFAKTVQLAGDRYSPLVSLAGALRECGRLDEAIHAAREAIALRPGEDQPWNILGEALEQQEKLEDAIVAFQKAVEVKSSAPGGHVNLGNAARAQGKFEEALRHYEKAIQCGDPAQAHFHRGLVLLLLGKFAEGWEEYERRWDLWHFPRPKFDKPLWDGSDLNGRTILLYTEQGFGDGIQFVRYASMVAKRGGRVVLDCQPELTSLLEGVEGLSKVVERGKPLGDFDVHMPLMSLPRLFGTWLESIPANVPYLHADPARVDAWRARLNTEGRPGKLRVGLVWAGSARYSQDWRRSGELKLFAPLAGIDADWYSLQKGEPAKQANDPSHGLRISDFTSELHDFADTAAFINHLDLLITVDTAAAHLAGALNRPVWTLLPFVPDWRWLLDRDDSPWYPRMRLFRQREVGNWRDVMLRVAGELQALIDKKP